MPRERVLFFIDDSNYAGQTFKEIFDRYKIDQTDIVSLESAVDLDNIDREYDVIVIEKGFKGDLRETAKFVQNLKKHTAIPIVGVDCLCCRGNAFTLLVAGCNFLVPNIVPNQTSPKIYKNEMEYYAQITSELCFLISDICKAKEEL